MHARLYLIGRDRILADRIDVICRRDPVHIATAAGRGYGFSFAVLMPHDMGTAAKAHHQENQRAPENEVEKSFH